MKTAKPKHRTHAQVSGQPELTVVPTKYGLSCVIIRRPVGPELTPETLHAAEDHADGDWCAGRPLPGFTDAEINTAMAERPDLNLSREQARAYVAWKQSCNPDWPA